MCPCPPAAADVWRSCHRRRFPRENDWWTQPVTARRRARPPSTPRPSTASDRDGYVVVDGLLDRRRARPLGAAVDRGGRRRKAARRPARSPSSSRYEQSFLQCMNLWEDRPDVRPLTFHPRLGPAAPSCCGVDAVRLWHDQALYKEPGGRATDAAPGPALLAHRRDRARSPRGSPSTGRRSTAARMGYVPGSHLIGLRRFVNIFSGEPEDILAHPDVAGHRAGVRGGPRGARSPSTTA